MSIRILLSIPHTRSSSTATRKMSTSGNPQDRQIDKDAHARTSNNSVAQNSSDDPCEEVRLRMADLDKNFRTQLMRDTEYKLHGLWSFVIKTAMTIPANDGPAQDRLIVEIWNARERSLPSSNPTTADGKLWSELPFMVGDFFKFWSDNWKGVKKEERLNLAAFTARLLARDEDALNLEVCALPLLRETLETRRGNGSDISLAELLPAAVAWFEFAGSTLVNSVRDTPRWRPDEGMEGLLAPVGELARRLHISPGFDARRWNFWKQRLNDLSSNDDEYIKEQARKGLECMHIASQSLGSH